MIANTTVSGLLCTPATGDSKGLTEDDATHTSGLHWPQ